LEKTGVTPQLVTDNGSQFTSAEFKDLVRRFAFEHLRIRTYHPESNGVIERFHRSTRDELSETTLTNLGHARTIIAAWIAHYNDHRLHAGIGYLPPAEYSRGDPAARQAVRPEKLARARVARRERNLERLATAA
jgi:putative transposase